MRLNDAEPVLGEELIALGRWIGGYYCAPLGEVLRSMLPLANDIRAGKVYSLTGAGRDASRQLSIEPESGDATTQLLALLASRDLSAAYLKKKIPAGGSRRSARSKNAAGSWEKKRSMSADRR